MKIIFVRHGQPDYVNDCLTELGHKQAAAAAMRLADYGIERIYSSTNGRALQTAAHTADRIGQEIVRCDFMREITWGPSDDAPVLADGQPWDVGAILVSEGKSLLSRNWENEEPLCHSALVQSVDAVRRGFDAWLSALGYQREGEYYRVMREDTYKAVAMFSHGGSSSVAMSHMLNVPFLQFCRAFMMHFTSITEISLSGKVGELIYPRMLIFNDAAHTSELYAKNVFGR